VLAQVLPAPLSACSEFGRVSVGWRSVPDERRMVLAQVGGAYLQSCSGYVANPTLGSGRGSSSALATPEGTNSAFGIGRGSSVGLTTPLPGGCERECSARSAADRHEARGKGRIGMPGPRDGGTGRPK